MENVALGETLRESDACQARVASKVWHSLGMCVTQVGISAQTPTSGVEGPREPPHHTLAHAWLT